MNTETLLPPLALALGRLRQARPAAPRHWPYAPRANITTTPTNDFLVIAPADALQGATATLTPEPNATVPGAEAARTYWFDL